MMQIRELTLGEELPNVAQLSRESFPSWLHSWLIQCQPGYSQYVIQRPTPEPRHYWLAEEGNDLVGYAEWREVGEVSFLNHFCVASSHQGKGVGSALLRNHISKSTAATVMLDVFADEPAYGFYIKLGFVAVESRKWMVRRLPRASRNGVRHLTCQNVDRWQTDMNRFGFGKLEAIWKGKDVDILFSSPQSARLSSPGLIADDEFLSAIHGLFPSVIRFGVIGEAADAFHVDEEFRSERMSVPVQSLRWS